MIKRLKDCKINNIIAIAFQQKSSVPNYIPIAPRTRNDKDTPCRRVFNH